MVDDERTPAPRRRQNGATWLAGILGVLLAVILIFLVAAFFLGESGPKEAGFVESTVASRAYWLRGGGKVEFGYTFLIPDEDAEVLTELLVQGGNKRVEEDLEQFLSQRTFKELDRDAAARAFLADEIKVLVMRDVVDPHNATEAGRKSPVNVLDVYLTDYRLVPVGASEEFAS